MRAKKEEPCRKIQYPIAFKLVSIITVLLLAALGSITLLVSYFVSEDVRITSEDNNFSANRRSASEAETRFTSVRSSALVLLDTWSSSEPFPGDTEDMEDTEDTDARLFFDRNRDIAAIIAGGREFLNTRYFLDNGLDPALPGRFIADQNEVLNRCQAGETIIMNGTPLFHAPMLVMFCPWQQEGETRPAAIFFTSDALSDSFGQGANSSFLVNDAGDLLAHPDYEMVRAGLNMADHPLVKLVRESGRDNLQTRYTGSDGTNYFGAYQNLTIGGAAVITNVESGRVFEGTVRTTRRNLYLTGAVLFAAVILIRLFANSISRPIKDLAAAAEEIEAGHFDLALKSKTRDEVGALTSSFAKMSGALEIFGRFTNREIAVRAMRGEIRPGGELRNATIFFSDIRNFTAISEGFTKNYGQGASDKIVYWLNEYFTRMIECVEKTNGVVDKFIGDSVMAHWGTAYTAGSPEKDALNCVRAALLMRRALFDLNREHVRNSGASPAIKIGCGINSGVVTAGQLGSAGRMEYTVIGDPVNLASRTEALNKPMGTDILITENTWRLIGKYLITEEMPPVTVKGKEKPVRLFAVVNFRAGAGRKQPMPRSLAEVRSLLGITPPDMAKIDTNAEETKYKIGAK